MKALLLTAGEGKRLRPLTEVLPKCLMPVNGIPLLAYWIDLLKDAGIKDILVNTHYLADQVTSYLNDLNHGLNIEISYEEKLLGTGGTILVNKNFFKEDSILVIHADNLSHFSLSDFQTTHKKRPSNCLMTMLSYKTTIPQSCGILKLDDRGIVRKFYEKIKNPPGDLANGAVYIFENEIISLLQDLNKEEIDLSIDVLPNLLGKIYTFHNDIYHRDIGTIESYCQAQLDFQFSCKSYSKTSPWFNCFNWTGFIDSFYNAFSKSISSSSKLLACSELDNTNEFADWNVVCDVPRGFLSSKYLAEKENKTLVLNQMDIK
ncbi:MAG: nucleotidyltransferase family protein [Bacteriovoracaceae bacterium]|nr:nucleotidyltransferase family protein [Bacteriovoracaceae bacterium]